MTTPLPIYNRPGLGALQYRIGTYGDFNASMLARLADRDPLFAALNQLRTRSTDDPTIALIDAFAILGDILTFYQERLANEGYLRTATQPQSLQYLSSLTGYQPSPGVASSVVLAFTLDPSSTVTVPAGSRAQSVPGPGQTAQPFEIGDDLQASGSWNAIQPRMTRPTQAAPNLLTVAVAGANTGLKPNDPVLQVVNGTPALRRVASIAPDPVRQRTVITLQQPPAAVAPATPVAAPSPSSPTSAPSSPASSAVPTPAAPAAGSTVAMASAPTTASGPVGATPATGSTPAATPGPAAGAPVTPAPASPQTFVTQQATNLAALARLPPAEHPPNAQALTRAVSQLFAPNTESTLALSAGLSPAQQAAVFTSLAQAPLAPAPQLEFHAFRAGTAPFGNRAPQQMVVDANGRMQPPQEWQLSGPTYGPELVFSIEVAALLGRRLGLRPFMREMSGALDRGGTFSEGVGFVTTIVFDDVSLELTLPLRQGAQATGTLSAALGDVTVTLNRLETRPDYRVEFLFAFTVQPLTVDLIHQGTDPPTATNQQQTTAQVTLDVSEDAAQTLRVLGTLRPVTGTQQGETPNVLYLDGTFETITPGSWVAFDSPAGPAAPLQVSTSSSSVNTVTRTAYGQTARTSRLMLSGNWIDPTKATFQGAIRETSVYADSMQLTLVDEDINDPVAQTATLELNGMVTGLTAGRWIVVSGERTDLTGVTAAELVMLAGASHGGETVSSATGTGTVTAAGETPHTTLTFSSPLAYSYLRDTVQVSGNVMTATQGATTDEILGSGNGASANQSFTLKKPPLTYVPAATPSGSANTLRVWVNNIEWQQVDTLASATPDAKVFTAPAKADGSCTVQFGDGVHGARLPTGTENVRARYRSGLGSSGNLDPGTITTLLSRPLGVTSVTNLAAASGGADPESPDDARTNIPLGLASLARLVSVDDYQNFAVAFAGIGKAAARRFAGPDGPLIHLTLAGAQDNALSASSPTWQTLHAALRQFGDPMLEVELAARAERLVVIQAGVAVDADQQWTDVEPLIRTALLNTFGFSQRALGQSLYVSEVIAAIQGVPGVSYVDLQQLAGVPQPTDPTQLQAQMAVDGIADIISHRARVDPASTGRPRRLLPAELVYLSDVLPDMLVLTGVTS